MVEKPIGDIAILVASALIYLYMMWNDIFSD